MPSAAYYRRQAQTCLILSRASHDPDLHRLFHDLAYEFLAKATAAEENAFTFAPLPRGEALASAE
jgi:hypothetical protein